MKTILTSAAFLLALVGGCETVFIAAPRGTEVHVIPPVPPQPLLILPPMEAPFDAVPEGMQAKK